MRSPKTPIYPVGDPRISETQSRGGGVGIDFRTRSPKSEFSAPTMAVNFAVTYRDGSDPNLPKGYYWLMEMGRDENGPVYGSLHGPQATEKHAEDDARTFLAAEIKRLSGGASLVHVKQ